MLVWLIVVHLKAPVFLTMELYFEIILKALPDGHCTPNHTCFCLSKQERSRNVSSRILQALNKIWLAVLGAKTPGDVDTVINTTNIAARLRKTLAQSIKDSTIEHDLGMFKLPKDEIVPASNLTANDAVNLQVALTLYKLIK